MTGFSERAMLSTDSAKAVKAQGYGHLNAIHYMAPAELGGVGNLCPHATPGCRALCLGEHSGQAAIVRKRDGTNAVRLARRAKAQAFMRDREGYMAKLERQIARVVRRAKREGLIPVIRLNGSTDIAYERVRYGERRATLLEVFPDIQFDEYTKNPRRLASAPANLSLTLSRSEANEADCIAALEAGHNVAVVFAGERPATWHGFPVIDGDQHDLRHLDPKGCVVGLSPKGARAKRDTSGFVVRSY